MNSEKTLKKYVNETFDSTCCDIQYTSSITARIEMIDGIIELLALNKIITVYIDGKEYQSLELREDGYFHFIY